MSVIFFKLGCFDVAVNCREDINVLLKNDAALVQLTSTLLELQEGIPGIVRWYPCHPVFKDSPHSIIVTEHLFHIGILVPKLIHSGQMLACTFPHIPCMVHKFVSHLDLCIFEPECDVLKVNIDSTFEH